MRSRAPQEGGTVKVIDVTPLETMHPSEIYYTHTSASAAACSTAR